ncbi:nitroreductase family protein [Patescibacteria group bacterium]|nr:nitroreductase family protein [Patescibacteria group bacterium]
MNNVKKIIAKRRSIRKYQDKKISDYAIKEIIEAARLAPSGSNCQPARYFAVRDEKTKAELKRNNIFKQDFIYTAPVIMVCCGDSSVYDQGKVDPKFKDSIAMATIRDVALAAQSLVLRATELGLGTCYIGWMNKAKIKKVLGINSKYVVPFVITLGYPAEKPKAKPRKSLKEILLGGL